MKKKNKNIIISISIIIVIIIILFIIFIYKNISAKPSIDTNNEIAQVDMSLSYEDKLTYDGFEIFFSEFTGDLKSSEILKGVKKIITKYLPEMYDIIINYNDEELYTFYDNNGKSLNNMFGIQDADSLINFAKVLKNKETDIRKFLKITVEKDTFQNESNLEGYGYAEFYVTYEDGTLIKFSLYVSKDKRNKPIYIVNAIDD